MHPSDHETPDISVRMHFTGSSCYHNRRVVASSLLEMIQSFRDHGFLSRGAITIKSRETLIRLLAPHTRGHEFLILMGSFACSDASIELSTPKECDESSLLFVLSLSSTRACSSAKPALMAQEDKILCPFPFPFVWHITIKHPPTPTPQTQPPDAAIC